MPIYIDIADSEKMQAEALREKCDTLSAVLGVEMEFDPLEAESCGAFREKALGEEEAREGVFDGAA